MKRPSDLIWLTLKDHMFWMVDTTTAIRFGEDINQAYLFPNVQNKMISVIDSGTSMVFVPHSLWSVFFDKLRKTVPHLKF